jgi:hypothetical protein
MSTLRTVLERAAAAHFARAADYTGDSPQQPRGIDMADPDNDLQGSPASDAGATPNEPVRKTQHKPVLHIGTEGEQLEEDGLEIDEQSLPTFGSDNLHT